ncbi:MAG: NAD(+) synthase [Alphaproteobacteria bacterium]|nr:NAD(+) synthase [Alphaproteobacteria bacterium]
MKIDTVKQKLVTQLKQYCQKNGFQDVVLGLSGGLDSAVVLALACEALGSHHVHTLMMTTKYTSLKSIELAQEAATLNHVSHQVINIQPTVDNLMKTLPFSPQNPVVEQNIQARARGVVAMAYSNEYNWLLLACGNKSELSVGYCTLYGDMCGGLAPIGDIYKTDVYKLAEYFNHEGRFFIPNGIIQRPPTAELANEQKDTDSLPPYPILDNILKNYLSDDKIVPDDIKNQVELIRQRYQKSAFKRLQSSQIIHI